MQIPVFIEPITAQGYRARSGEPFPATVEGPTKVDVLEKLRKLVGEKLTSGAEVVCLDIPGTEPPWLRKAGWLDLNHPIVQEWLEIMEENRKKDDESPDVL